MLMKSKIIVVRSISTGLFGLISFGVIAGAIAVPWQQLNRPVESTSPTDPNSNLSSPVIWPASGQITQGFHKYHEGLDIAGPVGTPVLAAKSGVVIAAGWDDWGLGNAITLQHEDGTRTIYGHNHLLLVQSGQEVHQGQIIAEMGSTGNSSGSHLHFEVYQHNQAIDPMTVLPPMGEKP